MEESNGYGLEKKISLVKAEKQPDENEKDQRNQHKTDQSRSPREEAAEEKGTEQKEPFENREKIMESGIHGAMPERECAMGIFCFLKAFGTHSDISPATRCWKRKKE